MSRLRLLLASCLLLAGPACAPQDGEETLVFAASSLARVLPEIGAAYERSTGQRVRFSFGSSAALARQVAAGAPAELFVSADRAVLATILERMPDDEAFFSLARNELAVVTMRGAAWPAGGLPDMERIAVGDWRAGVPVGLRAREWLAARGDWEALEGRLLPCADARATLAAVLSGAAPAGIVYSTDAVSEERVQVVERPAPGGPQVLYTVYELGPDSADGRSFARFLSGAPASAILQRHGFAPSAPPAGSRT